MSKMLAEYIYSHCRKIHVLYNNNRIDSTSMAIYLEVTEVTAAQQTVSEDNFTVGNSYGSSYKLTETPQKWCRLDYTEIRLTKRRLLKISNFH